ncbi:MAG: Zn-dependent exopeptidase M28 [Akkermansia sp.]|nr:Zn-dependent exopeptidase M28 [Akkermansia sp.]
MRRLFPLLLLLCSCDDQQPAPPAPPPAAQAPAELVDTPEFSGHNAYTHCAAICAMGPRYSGSAAYETQLQYLEKHLHAAGWQTARDTFAAPNGVRMCNLRAFRSSTPAPLLISCHVDTKINIAPDFQSADDGASGAAVLLELARTLKEERVELIFLDGEEAFAPRMSDEDGLYGSRFDVARRGSTLPRWQINLDMVGGRNKTIAVPALDTSDAMYAQYTAAVKTLGFSEMKWTAWPGSYLDDHVPYLEAGVDSLNLIAVFSGSNWWHTPLDNMSRICPRSLHESGLITRQLIGQLLSADGANAQ